MGACLPGGLSQRWEVVALESAVQREAGSGCLPVHNSEPPRRHRPL